ncbi:MAG: YfiR family protein [Ignavibacteriae bacterium]|nr:YfiR family protein [Ignavibacteriota bacterium]
MKSILLIIIALNFVVPEISVSQEISVPVIYQLQIFNKILYSNRNFNSIDKNNIEICIIYQKKFRLSSELKSQVLSFIEENSSFKELGNKKINFNVLSIETEKTLDNFLESNKVDIIMVTPLRAVDIEQLAKITRKHKVLSFSFIPEYIESGLSVGIGSKAERPQILINLKASKEEGVDFSSQLLKLSRIIE